MQEINSFLSPGAIRNLKISSIAHLWNCSLAYKFGADRKYLFLAWSLFFCHSFRSSLSLPHPTPGHVVSKWLVSTLANFKTKTQDEEKVVLIPLRLFAWFILDAEQMFVCDCFCLLQDVRDFLKLVLTQTPSLFSQAKIWKTENLVSWRWTFGSSINDSVVICQFDSAVPKMRFSYILTFSGTQSINIWMGWDGEKL